MLTVLSVCRTCRTPVSSELERTWKEVAMACSKYCHGICLMGLRRATDTVVLIAIAQAEIVT